MAEIVRFGVSLDKDLLTEFDRKIAEEGYETRSKAVGDLLKEYVIEKEFASLTVRGAYPAYCRISTNSTAATILIS